MSNNYKLYSEIELSSEVMSASAHRLVQLLFNSCLQRIELAKNFMVEKNPKKKCESIEKAMDIVEYLRGCLNHQDQKSQELATLLDAIYAYAQKNLLEAHINDDAVYLEEAKKVIADVKSGWDGIENKQ